MHSRQGLVATCRFHPRGHSDPAKRCADNINLHWHAIGYDSVGKWVAIKLIDGSSDGVLYDRKQEAVRHQSDEKQYCYVRLIGSIQMTECEAELFLDINRRLYDAGFRMTDPDSKTGGKQVLLSARQESRIAVLSTLQEARRRGLIK